MSKGVALIGLGVVAGGVAGSAVTAKRIIDTYRVDASEFLYSPYRHEYLVEEAEEQGLFEFTYYIDGFQGAFNRVGVKHVEALTRKGYKVEVREVHEYLVWNRQTPTPKKDFAFVHPLFFTQPECLKWLRKNHRYVVAFEVADTSKVSQHYVSYANNPKVNGLFLPSTFAVETYRRSGIMNKLRLVPHGVDPLFTKERDEVMTSNPLLKSIRKDPRPKILFFALHSVYSRKGGDVVYKALETLRRKGRDFLLVVKTHAPPNDYDLRTHFGDLPKVKVNTWLSEEDLVYLYDSCDLYLHPYKAGSFELNVFEALARGLPVIVTGWGCVLDYCNTHNSYLIKPEWALKIFPLTAVGHIGYGVEPSLDHTVELLEFVLDNIEYCKKKSQRNRAEFLRQTWDKTADTIIEGCREIWETQ